MTTTHHRPEASQRGARMLHTALGPAIARLLEDPAVVEVMLNPDGRLWVDRLSEGLSDTGERLSAADGERIVESRPTGFSEGSHIESFATIVLKSIRDKIGKGYPPETTLIVNCALNTAYHGFEWEQLMRQVQLRLPDHPFREIFVCSSNGWFCTSLASGPNPAS